MDIVYGVYAIELILMAGIYHHLGKIYKTNLEYDVGDYLCELLESIEAKMKAFETCLHVESANVRTGAVTRNKLLAGIYASVKKPKPKPKVKTVKKKVTKRKPKK